MREIWLGGVDGHRAEETVYQQCPQHDAEPEQQRQQALEYIERGKLATEYAIGRHDGKEGGPSLVADEVRHNGARKDDDACQQDGP